MKISDILSSSSKPFPSLEVVPPLKGMTRDELYSSIEPLMEFKPKYINVTRHRDEYEFIQNPDGSFTRRVTRARMSQKDVCETILSHFDTEMVPHIICAGSTVEDIRTELDKFKAMGIENVLALRGDCTAAEKRFTPTPGGYTYASELVAGIREYRKNEGRVYSIGVGGYPEKHFEAPNIRTDIENLKKKVDAGADYIITQMFFDNAVFYDFVDRCRQAGITVPIIPGLKPVTSAKQMTVLPDTFSLDIPYELSSEVLSHKDDTEAIYRIGTDWCTAQCKDLLAHGVNAIHFYTMGRSRNITEVLESCF